jgi:hypothetical protein
MRKGVFWWSRRAEGRAAFVKMLGFFAWRRALMGTERGPERGWPAEKQLHSSLGC